MNPVVSVIIANFNSQNYISDAIESILNQTFKDFELILVDDKSTDESLSIMKKFVKSDSRIKLIELSENHGVTYARQSGLTSSKGKYIAILDSDDTSSPTRLEEQSICLNLNDNIVLVASDYSVIDENGKIKNQHKKVQKNDASIKWYMTFGNCFAHSTIMFRSDTAKELGGYDLNIKRGLDMELSSKLLTRGKAFVIPKPLTQWRTYSKSMTKSVDKKELEKNYILSVQNSIYLHLQKEVDFETALAVFYNFKKPALNLDGFNNALELISIAYEIYSKKYQDEDLFYLKRAVLKHLLKISERNKNEIWWKDGEKYWSQIFKQCIGKQGLYKIIVKNYSQLSSRNIKNIISYKFRGLI